MKRGAKIPITNNAEYFGPDMEWTETYSGTIELQPGDILYHGSRSELKAFYPKLTCFHHNTIPAYDYVYAAVIKKAVKAKTYQNCHEIRLALSPDVADIYYIGTCTTERIYDEYGRVKQYRRVPDIIDIQEKLKK